MQSELPKVMDVNNETDAIKKLYGLDKKSTKNFGGKCLMARRLVEAGVRIR